VVKKINIYNFSSNKKSMPFAIAHFLATAAVMKLTGLLRLDRGRFLSARELFLCAFIGLLPDVDFLIQFVCWNVLGIRFWPHRIFTHNMIIPIVLLVIGLLLNRKDVNPYASKVFFLASVAWGVHVLMDFALMGPVRLFAPFTWTKFGFDICTLSGAQNLFIGLDAFLLVAWLGLRFIKHRNT